MIRKLREKKHMTQKQLADLLLVSDKTVSKWETGKGLPDISMIEPLSNALRVSVAELFAGECVVNCNRSANVNKIKFYVCPLCQNVITALGEGTFSCCGIRLTAAEAEKCSDCADSNENNKHLIQVERIDDEYAVTVAHPMEKNHYISFIAYVSSQRFQLEKLYPEQNAQARFRIQGHGKFYIYCNKDGLFYQTI
jgi:desulfoferrodoxin